MIVVQPRPASSPSHPSGQRPWGRPKVADPSGGGHQRHVVRAVGDTRGDTRDKRPWQLQQCPQLAGLMVVQNRRPGRGQLPRAGLGLLGEQHVVVQVPAAQQRRQSCTDRRLTRPHEADKEDPSPRGPKAMRSWFCRIAGGRNPRVADGPKAMRSWFCRIAGDGHRCLRTVSIRRPSRSSSCRRARPTS